MFYSLNNLAQIYVLFLTVSFFLVFPLIPQFSFKFVGLPIQALIFWLFLGVKHKTNVYVSYLVVIILAVLIFSNLINKTHGSILLACCVIFSGKISLHLAAIIILYYVNAKMPLLLLGFSMMWLKRESKILIIIITAVISYILYSLIDHWLNYDLDQIWTLRNRMLAFEAYVFYFQADPMRALFPISPSEIYPRALDNGLLVGMARYGILGFIMFVALLVSFLRNYFDWARVVMLLVPFLTQSYLLHPIVFMCFILFLSVNHNRVKFYA